MNIDREPFDVVERRARRQIMVIDSHTHIFPHSMIESRERICSRDSWFKQLYGEGANMATYDELLSSMDDAGIEKSVVMGFGWQHGVDCTISNEYIMESSARSGGRIVPFVSVVPGPEDVSHELDRWSSSNLRGVGELYADSQGFDMADLTSLGAVVEVCVARGLFLCVHITEPVGHYYAGKDSNGPASVGEFVMSMPSELKLILPHWGGGFGFYELMPEMRMRTSNCFYDSAASHLLYDERVYSLMTQLAPGRVLFGSDYPLTSQARMLGRIVRAGLPDSDLQQFLGGNAIAAGLH